jgi:peptide/nickel transport system permease protein
MNLGQGLQGPSWSHPLGTDALGRCLLSRLLVGARYSLGLSAAVVAATMALGAAVGSLAGMAGGKTDLLLSRVIDLFLAVPPLVMALGIIGGLGPSLGNLLLALLLSYWAPYARLTRGMVIAGKEREFVEASRLAGSRGLALFRRCLLPQILPALLVLASLEAGMMVAVNAGLSFLGIGVQPPTPEWGVMLYDARLALSSNPWVLVPPSATLCLAVLSFNLLGEGLRDALQVRKVSRF